MIPVLEDNSVTSESQPISLPREMTGENIICFAKDWNEASTCCNHVLLELAKNNRVLWINSIATRAPNFGNARDIRKIAQKLLSFMKGPKRVTENLWIYTPIVLPFHNSRWVTFCNGKMLGLCLQFLRRRLGMNVFQLWSFVPTAAEYVGVFGEDLAVYYCTDEWSLFSFVTDPAQMAAVEQKLCERADIVFATAQTLVDRKSVFNSETHLATHGVDWPMFSRALDDATTVPSDIKLMGKTILGFYGTIDDWVDLDLIVYMAEHHPEWSIVLIGKVLVDVSHVAAYENVHLLGLRPHNELYRYCKAFSVGLIPYKSTERMKYVNPVKLREYLSAGLPVVSTDAVPEVQRYSEHCTIAATHEAFKIAVESIVQKQETKQNRYSRSISMREETWERKVLALGETVMRLKSR